MKRFLHITTKFTAVITLCMLLLLACTVTGFAASGQNESGKKYTQAIARLQHTSYGKAEILYSPYTGTFAIKVFATGLKPGGLYPVTVNLGNACPQYGAPLTRLNDIYADFTGNGKSITYFSYGSSTAGLANPAQLSINLYAGPTLNTPDESLPIACGNFQQAGYVPNSTFHTFAAPNNAQHDKDRFILLARTVLGPTAGANQNAYGYAVLTLIGNILIIDTYVYNLVPNTAHTAHIHSGSCEKQNNGQIVYPLNTVVANNNGVGYSRTIISNGYSIPKNKWHVNIHFSTHLSTQAGYDVIACGNVEPTK